MASGDLGGETSVLVGDEDVMPVLVRELSNAWRRSGEPSYDSATARRPGAGLLLRQDAAYGLGTGAAGVLQGCRRWALLRALRWPRWPCRREQRSGRPLGLPSRGWRRAGTTPTPQS